MGETDSVSFCGKQIEKNTEFNPPVYGIGWFPSKANCIPDY